MPEPGQSQPSWRPVALAAGAGAALAALAGFGGLVAAMAGALAQVAFGLAVSWQRRTRAPQRVPPPRAFPHNRRVFRAA